MKETRRLSTILFADIAGYTAIMQSDEVKALSFLGIFKETLKKITPEYKGQIIQFFGDGCLLSFDSASQGVRCSMALQQIYLKEDVPVRMGIHLGEVVFKENNAFGDGVNIASRIESMGVPGAILLSKTVRDQIINKAEFELASLGVFEFKNVEEPLDVYALANAGLIVPVSTELKGKLKESRTGKTIAVLPFANLSSDQEQEYFSDGLTEEIIADLSQLQELQVISRTSVFTFKGTNKNLRTIGKELGVRFILEGSVRKMGNNIRITAQLINAATDQHLWAEKYKGTIEDIFDLQEDVSRQIVSALKIQLTQKEKRQMANRPIENAEAYDLYLKALRDIRQPTETSLQRAMELIDRALILIGDNEVLLRTKGQIHLSYINLGLKPDVSHAKAAEELVSKIYSLNPDSQEGHFLMGLSLVHSWHTQEAAHLLKKVLDRDPNNIDALRWYVIICMEAGQPTHTYPFIQHLLELDPLTGFNHCLLGWYYYTLNEIEKATFYYRKGYEMDPNHPFIGFFYASLLPVANEMEKAIDILEKAESFPPQLIIPHLAGFLKFALLGQKEKALALVTEQLKEQASWNSNTCFQLARVYALLNEKTEMINWLKLALDKGYYNDLMLLTIGDFTPYLEDPDFQHVLAGIRKKREHFIV